MSNIESDQPLPPAAVAALSPEEVIAQQLLQAAAGRLAQAHKGVIDQRGTIDLTDNEITTRIMFVHINALTNLMVDKGLLKKLDVQKALTAAFLTSEQQINRPQLLVPQAPLKNNGKLI